MGVALERASLPAPGRALRPLAGGSRRVCSAGLEQTGGRHPLFQAAACSANPPAPQTSWARRSGVVLPLGGLNAQPTVVFWKGCGCASPPVRRVSPHLFLLSSLPPGLHYQRGEMAYGKLRNHPGNLCGCCRGGGTTESCSCPLRNFSRWLFHTESMAIIWSLDSLMLHPNVASSQHYIMQNRQRCI